MKEAKSSETTNVPPPAYDWNSRRSQKPAGRPIVPVSVVDFDMSFGHLVVFFIKAGLAAIPAGIVLFFVFWTLYHVLLGMARA